MPNGEGAPAPPVATETVELAQFAAGNLSRDGKSGDVLACAGLQGFPAASVDSLEQ